MNVKFHMYYFHAKNWWWRSRYITFLRKLQQLLAVIMLNKMPFSDEICKCVDCLIVTTVKMLDQKANQRWKHTLKYRKSVNFDQQLVINGLTERLVTAQFGSQSWSCYLDSRDPIHRLGKPINQQCLGKLKFQYVLHTCPVLLKYVPNFYNIF